MAAFHARGIKVDAPPRSAAARPSRAPRTGPGYDLQNAYDAHLQRQAAPAFGASQDLSQDVSTPFTQGIVNARAAAIQSKTGQSATMFTRQAGDLDASGQHFSDQGQQNADDFTARERLAESGGSDQQFNSSLNGMVKTDETGAKTEALGHAMPHIPPEQQDIFKSMADDPSISAHDFYGHLIQSTAPKTAKATDPVEQYKKYAALHSELSKEDASDPQVANALRSTHDEMSKYLDQISPPGPAPVVRTPQPQDNVKPTVALGDGAMSANPFQSRPSGGASTPPIAGLGKPEEAPPAAEASAQTLGPSTPGGWNGHAEGTMLTSPKTGRQFKIVDGQPQEITNAGN